MNSVGFNELLLLEEIEALTPDERVALLAAMAADPKALARLVLHARLTHDLVHDLKARKLRPRAQR